MNILIRYKDGREIEYQNIITFSIYPSDNGMEPCFIMCGLEKTPCYINMSEVEYIWHRAVTPYVS